MTTSWAVADIPPLHGKRVVITGGTSGIGLESAKAMVKAGASVTITGRYPETGQAIAAQINKQALEGGSVDYEQIDTSDLASVTSFCERITNRFDHIDILINCAGLSRMQKRKESVGGFEMQFAANYLGHFALTGRLLPLLKRAPSARVIGLSSIAHQKGKIDFDDLQGEQRYTPLKAYGQSKLAMLLFSRELQRRATECGWPLISIPVHPGLARTNIFKVAFAGLPIRSYLIDLSLRFIGQSAEMGALPILFAATSANAKGGIYYGPKGFQEFRGYPTEAIVFPQGQDEATARRLWDISEQLSGVTYRF